MASDDASTFGGDSAQNATFGSGLNYIGGGGADPGSNGADVPPGSPAPVQPMAQAPQQSAPSFGSMLGGPRYTPPDPNTSPLDQTADTLQQRIQRANSVATNPMLQLFDPASVQKARDFVPAATEQLQKIKQQKADIAAGRAEASSLGLNPGDAPDEATHDDRVSVAVNKSLQGDLKTFKGLSAVDPQRAASIQDQVHEAASTHLNNAQLAFDSLSSVPNQGQYTAKLNQLRKDGTLTDLEALGLKLPESYDAFNASKPAEGEQLRQARVGMENLKAKIDERGNGTPMSADEQKTYAGRLTTESGQAINNGTWSRINGKRVYTVNGQGDIRDLGTKFNYANADQRKQFGEETAAAVPKTDLEKDRNFNRLYSIATVDAKGNAIPASGAVDEKGNRTYLNTNPNVQQGIAEGLASMLRGGSGGATSGLLNIETSKRGAVQAVLDKIISNYAGGVNTLTGDQVKPYLSQMTQEQMRSVMDGLKGYNDKAMSDRLAPIAQRAGELGLDASALGLGKDEVKGVQDAIEAGRQSTIARFTARSRAIGGGDGGIFLDNPPPVLVTHPDHPPGSVPEVPPPVQGQGGAPQPLPGAAGGGQPSGPGGGGPGGGGPAPTPITIAGQPVAPRVPPGGTPGYFPAMQRIESGNEKTPWTAGTPKTSASGAFQMTDATWLENRPAGVTAMRAKDATPAQQTQAAETFTAKNAGKLQQNNLPVNDVNLYVAHNLGANGAAKLLHADPNADARTVVGDVAANNNPMFYKGRPTVAVAMQRYAAEMGKGTAQQPVNTASLPDVGAAPWNGATTPQGDRIATPAERAAGPVVGNAPAIGSTVGSIAGAAAGGPVGSVAGGAAGGGAGQAFQSWMRGESQDPVKIAKQAALGGVLGIAPEARPLLGAAARVGGAAAVDAGATAAGGGSTADVIDSAVEGGSYALGGEMLGRFISALGPAAHRVLSNYKPDAQVQMSEMAGKLSEARKTLETEEPKIAGAAGASSPNPKYDAAKAQEEAASEFIKAHGQSPEDMVYAYDQAKGPTPTSAGEAFTMRRANSERANVSAGYNELRQQVNDTGVGAPKPNQPVPDGPVAQLRTADNMTGSVPEQFRPQAEHAEMLIKAPAQNWGQKWQQLQDAGSELIRQRMDFLNAGDKTSATAMNNLFQGVRNQQKAAAEYVFGADRGKAIISNLENLDQRYAKVMNATNGMNYEKMRTTLAAGNTPEARELEKNFTEFAKGDPSAMRAFNAMKAGAKGDWKSEAALMTPIIAGEAATNASGIPTLGAVSAAIGGYRLYKIAQGYMNARILGKAVMFKDFLANEAKNGFPSLAQGAAQRGAVQGAQ